MENFNFLLGACYYSATLYSSSYNLILALTNVRLLHLNLFSPVFIGSFVWYLQIEVDVLIFFWIVVSKALLSSTICLMTVTKTKLTVKKS